MFVRAGTEDRARTIATERIEERGLPEFEITRIDRMSGTGWRVHYQYPREAASGEWGAGAVPVTEPDWGPGR